MTANECDLIFYLAILVFFLLLTCIISATSTINKIIEYRYAAVSKKECLCQFRDVNNDFVKGDDLTQSACCGCAKDENNNNAIS